MALKQSVLGEMFNDLGLDPAHPHTGANLAKDGHMRPPPQVAAASSVPVQAIEAARVEPIAPAPPVAVLEASLQEADPAPVLPPVLEEPKPDVELAPVEAASVVQPRPQQVVEPVTKKASRSQRKVTSSV